MLRVETVCLSNAIHANKAQMHCGIMWRLYHRAGKADQVSPNRRPVTSHNVAGNTREKQLQMPKETSQK